MNIMQKKKGKKGLFAIKIDLSKAYDKLNWDFIAQILREVNIPDSMFNVIMHFVSSVETNVMWKGVRSEFFRPQRGIRQGGPISLYFLCCAWISSPILLSKKFCRRSGKRLKWGSIDLTFPI